MLIRILISTLVINSLILSTWARYPPIISFLFSKASYIIFIKTSMPLNGINTIALCKTLSNYLQDLTLNVVMAISIEHLFRLTCVMVIPVVTIVFVVTVTRDREEQHTQQCLHLSHRCVLRNILSYSTYIRVES